MPLNNFTSLHPVEIDIWEVDHFDEDCEGRKLAEPLLGVRVNKGRWIEVRLLLEFIAEREEQLHGTH